MLVSGPHPGPTIDKLEPTDKLMITRKYSCAYIVVG